MTLSICCLTRGEPHAAPFVRDLAALARGLGAEFVLGLDRVPDGHAFYDRALDARKIPLASAGYLESVHDDLIGYCRGDYILRLDDDERCSEAMAAWLLDRTYEQADHWCFPRAYLWRDPHSFILNPPLWPDYQTRLSVRAKAGGRTTVHVASPFGRGEVADVVIEHHKFLVKALSERRALAAAYDTLAPGAGSGVFRVFQTPEDVVRTLTLAPLYDGAYSRLRPTEIVPT